MNLKKPHISLQVLGLLFIAVISIPSCNIYKFKDVSIDPRAKTCHIVPVTNTASYNNPQLAPQLSDKLRQKVNNQTRLTLIPREDADYYIKCEITGYNVTTAGISQQQAATNRLVVTVKVTFRNKLEEKKNFESPVSRNFDFSANLSLNQAETQLTSTIVQNMVDEIFTKIFSDW
jgi:Lipopolysaccharide-assembly